MFRKREWVLLAGLLVAYNINLRQVSSYDTYASRFVPISILRDAGQAGTAGGQRHNATANPSTAGVCVQIARLAVDHTDVPNP